MTTLSLATDNSIVGIDVAKAAELFAKRNECGVHYVMDTCVRSKDGNWADQPVALFYSVKEHPVSKSHYFALFVQNGSVCVTDGQSAVDHTYSGLVYNNKVYHSRYRHDYRQVGGVAIDGGLDYVRLVGDVHSAKQVQFKIVTGQMVIVEPKENQNQLGAL